MELFYYHYDCEHETNDVITCTNCGKPITTSNTDLEYRQNKNKFSYMCKLQHIGSCIGLEYSYNKCVGEDKCPIIK